MAIHVGPIRQRQTNKLANSKSPLFTASGLASIPVYNRSSQLIGKLVDLVFHWDTDEKYPPLSGIIVKVAGHQVWIGVENIEKLRSSKVILNNSKLDLRDFKPRIGEVRLLSQVLDHQLIDLDGTRVVRASELYLAVIGKKTRLVGLDVGYRAIIRRLGPKQIKIKPNPDNLIDWATIQSFGGAGGNNKVKLNKKRQDLKKIRPSELADLLEDLGREERRELLKSLSTEQIADALEEMEAEELKTILKETTPTEIAKYLSNMEPDEAAEALRDVDPNLRGNILLHMTSSSMEQVEEVLSYDESTAGGIMTTKLQTAKLNQTAGDILKQLSKPDIELESPESIVVVNDRGKFVYDLSLIDIVRSKKGTKLSKLIKVPVPVTATPDSSVRKVAQLLVDSRSTSIVVLNASNRPIGRILADDVVDSLLPRSGGFHFPRLWS